MICFWNTNIWAWKMHLHYLEFSWLGLTVLDYIPPDFSHLVLRSSPVFLLILTTCFCFFNYVSLQIHFLGGWEDGWSLWFWNGVLSALSEVESVQNQINHFRHLCCVRFHAAYCVVALCAIWPFVVESHCSSLEKEHFCPIWCMQKLAIFCD